MRQHRQQEKEEQAGVGSQLHHILLTHKKQLCTNAGSDTRVTTLFSCSFSRLGLQLHPGEFPSATTEPGNRRARTDPSVPAHSHTLAISATIPSSLRYRIVRQSLRVEGNHSCFFPLDQDGLGTNLNLKYTFGPVRGNYLESYLIIGKVSQCALFSFSVLNFLPLCIFLYSSAQFHACANAHAPPLHPVIPQLAVIPSCCSSSSVMKHVGSLLPTYSLIKVL